MKTRSKVLSLACAAALALGSCQQNTFLLDNARASTPATTPHLKPAKAAVAPYSPSFLNECEFQIEQFSSRFYGNMSLPHQAMVQY